MDETMEITQDLVDQAWDGSDDYISDDVEAGADQPDEPKQEQETVDEPAGGTETHEEPGGDSKADQPELFTIKNRDEQRQVTREELVSMAQKGWDYDKVREERDQLRQYRAETDPAMEVIKRYAARSNMSVSEYLDYCRKQELIATGMSEKDAAQKVSFDKERAELDRQRAELDARDQQANEARRMAQEKAQARQKDIENFYRVYPGVDPNSIPKEVWDAVKAGDTLTGAYTRWENSKLKAELAAERQNKKNKAAAPGSMSGNDMETQADLISKWWDEA